MSIISALRRPFGLAAVAFLCFLIGAFGSEFVARQPSGLTSLWPANAVLLGFVLMRGTNRARTLALLGGGAAASLVFSVAAGRPSLAAILFPVANMLEVALAAALLRLLGSADGTFDRVRNVLALMLACCTAPILSAAIGAIALRYGAGVPFASGWISWYGAAALSLALVTPTTVVALQLVDGTRHRVVALRQVSEVIVILGLVAAVATIVFAASTLPSLFVILPFVLLATFRLRQFGAVAAVAIVACVSAYATAQGLGPIARSALDQTQQVLFLQFFLAVTFVTSLPVAATLAERDARAEEAHMIADHFKAVVENASEVIFRTDLQGRWTYLNPAWEPLSGYPINASLGQPLAACVVEVERRELADWAQPVFDGEVRATRRMLRFLTAGGSVRWMELSIQGLTDQDGAIIGATGALRDIDDRKRLEEHVLTAKRRAEERARAATVLASTDELTGLANRRAFLRHLDRQSEASSEFGWRLTVAMFDVDHFKRVNDRHGHAVGDRVLQLVAARAVGIVRSGDLVGRLGGEEFGILMPGASAEDAAVVAERLRQAIESPSLAEDGTTLPIVTVSIGIAAQEPDQTGADLLSSADEALYAAKDAGRNRVKVAA